MMSLAIPYTFVSCSIPGMSSGARTGSCIYAQEVNLGTGDYTIHMKLLG